jgi:5-methylcytosine-specific restriction endonuclease McrA
MKFADLHQQAVQTAGNIRKSEHKLLCILQAIDASEGYKEMEYTCISRYMTGELRYSRPSAWTFITVFRKAAQITDLQFALLQDELTISQVKTIASVVTKESAARWIRLAKTCTVRELERAVARENPAVLEVERIVHRAKDQVDLTVTLKEKTIDLLMRSQEVLRQNRNDNASLAEVIHIVTEYFVENVDPLKRAERKRPEKRTEREKALLRDGGACQFKMPDGKICDLKYWTDVHHIDPLSKGGADSLENLITYCRAHHRMVHDPPITA